MLDQNGGIQWPCPAQDAPAPPAGKSTVPQTHRRLFEDGEFYHADGRAKFLFENPRRMPEPPSPAFPLLLLTGRGTAAQWHTQTRTQKSADMPGAFSTPRLRRPQSRGRPPAGNRAKRAGDRRIATREPAGASLHHARCRGRSGFHSHALRNRQPVDRRRVRPVLAPTLVQGVRSSRTAGGSHQLIDFTNRLRWRQRIRSGTRQSSEKPMKRPEFWRIQLRVVRKCGLTDFPPMGV